MPAELVDLIKFEASQETPLQGYFELHWFDDEVLSRFIIDAKMRERFAVFGKTSDGYPYLLWLDDNNIQRVVVFYTGDYAVYLADSFTDFMLLLSMGHFEEGDKNINFKPGIEKTFEMEIPKDDADLLKNMEQKKLAFNKWMHKNCKGFLS